jgi:hypothetical protein
MEKEKKNSSSSSRGRGRGRGGGRGRGRGGKTVVAKKEEKKEESEWTEDDFKLVFVNCQENNKFLIETNNKLVLNSEKKIIGQYRRSINGFYFISQVCESLKRKIKCLQLEYHDKRMHDQPPHYYVTDGMTYDDQVKFWNKRIEEEGKGEEPYHDGREIWKYFKKMSKKVFRIEDKRILRMLDERMKCSYIDDDTGLWCEHELEEDDCFCNYHTNFVDSKPGEYNRIEKENQKRFDEKQFNEKKQKEKEEPLD